MRWVSSDVKMDAAKMSVYPLVRSWNLSFLSTWLSCCLLAGVHDKPAEADRPQRTYDEGFVPPGDRVQGHCSCRWKVRLLRLIVPSCSTRRSNLPFFIHRWVKFVLLLHFRATNISEIHAMGIHMLPGYNDPYHGRPLTKGELGCFLSHYNVWKEVTPPPPSKARRLSVCEAQINLINLCLAVGCGATPAHLPRDRRRPALWDLLQATLDELDEGGGGWRTGLGSHVSSRCLQKSLIVKVCKWLSLHRSISFSTVILVARECKWITRRKPCLIYTA